MALKDSGLSKYFNFSESSDPFLIKLSEHCYTENPYY